MLDKLEAICRCSFRMSPIPLNVCFSSLSGCANKSCKMSFHTLVNDFIFRSMTSNEGAINSPDVVSFDEVWCLIGWTLYHPLHAMCLWDSSMMWRQMSIFLSLTLSSKQQRTFDCVQSFSFGNRMEKKRFHLAKWGQWKFVTQTNRSG